MCGYHTQKVSIKSPDYLKILKIIPWFTFQSCEMSKVLNFDTFLGKKCYKRELSLSYVYKVNKKDHKNCFQYG